MSVRRIFVEKIAGMDVSAKAVAADLKNNLGISGLKNVRLLNRYDVEGISEEEYEAAKYLVFSEPNVDDVTDEEFKCPDGCKLFAVEYLPGQYDQRADSAAQCIQILTQKERPEVRAAQIYVLEGDISDADVEAIKKYSINPVESREASLEKPETLKLKLDIPEMVDTLKGFINLGDEEIKKMRSDMGLAMSAEDLLFCRNYFKDTEKRDPTITEIRVIDTYWSDHCRHTTFLTKLNNITFAKGPENELVEKAFKEYLLARENVYGERAKTRDITLMDAGTLATKYLKKNGKIKDLDESEEINACSIKIKVDVDGEEQDWLLMFKNETHNHPTEIEPFGGAATCLGGAIRDPLSGRSYVYQAMRVTGSADPTVPVSQTIKGKLSQRKITTGAAAGYSSYGNQIGLATGHVREIYHKGYMAKRMEIGAVIAAAPADNVVRERPDAGDVVILLGGRTGRDGIGGATGSSKEHTVESVTTCGSEVQKGNPPTERKLQRLFRNPTASKMIKRCNDFGAGGVCVAIGELAPALNIDLDKVPKKYEGLDGTELAISESQERMAVVVKAEDADKFIALANTENLEAVKVADITDTGRLKMYWKGNTIVNIAREFLDTNGVKQNADVTVDVTKFRPEKEHICKCDSSKSVKENWLALLGQLNVCSQKGLEERFDSTIGNNTVVMPYAGKYQFTPSDGMAAKIAVEKGDTKTGSIMTYGFDPYMMEDNPYVGAMYSVVSSLAKLTAMGGDYKKSYLTFQEYFERLGTDPNKWGIPFAALLGAFRAQVEMGTSAIGGKDSMSGTFEQIHVPPTLVSFAVAAENINNMRSQEFKKPGNKVVLYTMPKDENGIPNYADIREMYSYIHELIVKGDVVSAKAVGFGGIAESISYMCFGNKLGFKFEYSPELEELQLFEKGYGSLILELADSVNVNTLDSRLLLLGEVTENSSVTYGDSVISVEEMLAVWRKTLDNVFPEKAADTSDNVNIPLYNEVNRKSPAVKIAKPRVFIPVFPGTNCEYDTIKAFEKEGAIATPFIFKNLSASDIEESVAEMKKLIDNAQIIMIPGGFSGGDEPDGSGKFIATAFRNPVIKEAVDNLLNKRDGLMLGICNGFQALIKLGLVPYGEIRALSKEAPTLTFNTIGRHISRYVYTRVVSNKSPWLMNTTPGEVHAVPISHGEGRFVAEPAVLENLIKNNQIATQYVDDKGNPSNDSEWNPNGSICAIEGITSPDGRILGKMAHSERYGNLIGCNIPGDKNQKIFASGVEYFTK
ncbi:MAG: phosphoribosylformylglycinamidine synthase [Clostridia bacterium]|nr:phosphoribosylformylglycinamidine synthase [Clostridia bacterium]